MERGFALGVIIILLLSGSALALEGTHVLVNSEDWKDVYSSLLYSRLTGKGSSFLTSTSYGPVILNGIAKSNSLAVVSSEDVPFVINYPSIIRPRGYAGVDELVTESANLDLVDEEELSDIDKFVVVGDSYGYNAIAVAPYASLTRSWVLFATRVNIAEVEALLDRRDPEEIIIYGYVDREVNEALAKFNPEVINTGDRFEDNIEIVKKFKELQDAPQVTLTNGEFLEQEATNGRNPILFTGRQNVPAKIAEYLKGSDIEVGVLIGNELIQAATNIRRSAGISVMVKFARSARTPSAGVSQVQGLDLFPLPAPILNLEIQSIKYNQLSSQLEVTYLSKSNVPIYLKGTIAIESDGDRQRVGDIDPIYVAPNDYKTLSYPDVQANVDGTLKAEVNTLFGEVSTSLDRELTGSFDIGVINVLDKCEIEVTSVTYVKQSEYFVTRVENIGDHDCYVDIEFADVKINDVRQVIGTEGSEFIKAGRTGKVILKQRMDETDLEDNPFINLVAYYGEREDSLVKIFKGKFELEIDLFNSLTYWMIIVFILLILLAIIIFILKRRNEDW